MPLEELGVLTLTHSSRTTNLARCSAEFLSRRFGDPERLQNLPPFESLPPAEVLYSGAVSFHRVLKEAGHVRLESLGHVRSRDRIQDVALLGGADILIGVALACSTPDAVLIFDLARGVVESTLRLPSSLYGIGYEIEAADLRRHAIPDEAQTTHINAAHRAGGSRLVVSALIQGAIGVFDLESGVYEEICRGFTGCHGARRSAEGEIYFADSTAGTLVFLTPEGQIARHFATGSRWLHDVRQLAGSIYAFALADTNELRLYDVASGELLWSRRFFLWPMPGLFRAARWLPGWLGNSVQALGFYPGSDGIPPAG